MTGNLARIISNIVKAAHDAAAAYIADATKPGITEKEALAFEWEAKRLYAYAELASAGYHDAIKWLCDTLYLSDLWNEYRDEIGDYTYGM